jgi:hypothetical protein
MQKQTSSLLIAISAIAMCACDALAQTGSAPIPQSSVQRATFSGAGQPIESCIAGRIFGITEFQCTSCGMASPRDSSHIVYSFGSEPFVVETDSPTNRIRPGDRVVAVNGNPITTRAGADQFAYPPVGTATLTVRRNNVNISIDQLVSTPRNCPARGFIHVAYLDSTRFNGTSVPITRGISGGRGGGGRGGARVGAVMRADTTGMTAAQIDSANARVRAAVARGTQVVRPARTEQIIDQKVQFPDFGFTLTCQPVCTRTRSRDGAVQYWRFDAFPVVSNLLPSSVAARAGLRDGDVLLRINEVSPQVEEGALILNRVDPGSEWRLEVNRGGSIQKITLKKS